MRSASDRGAPLAAPSASLTRRALALAYEVLLLFALLLVSALPFVMITHAADAIVARPLFQIYLLAVAAAYFIGQWRRGGQTLAMKTWRIRIVTREGAPLALRHALSRFVFAAGRQPARGRRVPVGAGGPRGTVPARPARRNADRELLIRAPAVPSSRFQVQGSRLIGPDASARKTLNFEHGTLNYLRSCHHIITIAMKRKIAVGMTAAANGGQAFSSPRCAKRRFRK